jgi:hypothetical protein
MSIEQDKHWITGEEFGCERWRLIQAGVHDDAPEFEELYRGVRERDDYPFERYGKPYMTADPGKWVAISLDGQVLFREHDWQASADGRQTFGGGNYCVRRLAEEQGYRLHSPRKLIR